MLFIYSFCSSSKEKGRNNENINRYKQKKKGDPFPSPPPFPRFSRLVISKTCHNANKQQLVQVTRLLDVKREDVKAKRAAEASSGVVARRGKAAAAAKKRRRSQVEKGLALKRADELLEESGKAEDIRQRRGSLGTLRPEDVSYIAV